MRSQLDLPIVSFKSARDWESWIAKNHARTNGVWIRFFKKGSGRATVTYAEALDGALCYGWIDSQARGYDELSYLQKFGPRKPKSGWSKINTRHAERLCKAGRMKLAGLAQIQAAKRDGRWTRAYDSPAAAKPPVDFLRALEKNKKAKAFFAALEKRNSYAIIYRLQTAKKPETRAARMKTIIAMLAKGEKFHP
ncbi:MAG TPA: YdeI/OmpD-associated family protein [Xanthobacteraceae bacterium]|nr:YdeI/OmpD-associated family protein [Xanthobacteraceae bacterium]